MSLRSIIWNSRFLTDQQRIEWYPPFWLKRIKVSELSPCWRKIRIRLPQSWLSRNPGGSLFGGYQACLADPIAAMACYKVFPGYAIWTRSLHLDFRHEGSGDLELRFTLNPAQEMQIKTELAEKGRSTPIFEYGYYRVDGGLCTLIKAAVAIRPHGYKKPRHVRRDSNS